MRDIKFRGKRIYNGEWAYGWLVKGGSDHVYYIILETVTIHHLRQNNLQPTIIEIIPVTPETIGQYTGLKDENGVEIYEGDIVIHLAKVYKIAYHGASFSFINEAGEWDGYLMVQGSDRLKVIGNIYDNPELLETKDNE